MCDGDEGLSLDALARRLEALEQENAGLRDEVSALKGSGTRLKAAPFSGFEGTVSRRSLLTKGGVVALGAVAAGTLLSTREARADTTSFDTVVANEIVASTRGMRGYNTAQFGVGIRGEATTGVLGLSGAFGAAGVLGRNANGEGVRGEGSTFADVAGVRGLGKAGVWGSSAATGYEGVYGQHTGSAGYGVVGDGKGNGAGVLGRNGAGVGVEGRDSKYGGRFAGTRAQLALVPKGTVGKPTSGSHSRGEIFMDSVATLFVCTKGGTSGTWRKVTTTAV